MKSDLLIYGSYGYTGELVVREALERGLAPTLAGRDRNRLEAQARELGLDYQLFDLEGAKLLRANLEDVRVVLNCAGPFSRTAAPMVAACLRTGTHYLDITGEMAVFETLARLGTEAEEAGVMLLPGVGFDVVPTDCLAASLASRLPAATRLSLAVQVPAAASRGTARTLLNGLGDGGASRRDGKIVRVPFFHRSRRVDFGQGPRRAVGAPLADVATAYYSTGIADIETFVAVPAALGGLVAVGRPFGSLLRWNALQRNLGAWIGALPAGPGKEARARGRSRIWGEAASDAGERVEGRLEAPEPYTFTARSAVKVAGKALTGEVRPGFQTPSLAYGAALAGEIDGVVCERD